jgi:hypothetical protein
MYSPSSIVGRRFKTLPRPAIANSKCFPELAPIDNSIRRAYASTEGWTLYQLPGPQLQGVTDPGSAEASYYDWVDQFDTFGLRKNVPIATGNGNDALLALLPDSGKFVVLRVPYPMGFYAKGMDGRIDDSKAGWKGKGLWATYGTRTPFHAEGGKGTTSKVVHFQLRLTLLRTKRRIC